jgi:hypothetical protein
VLKADLYVFRRNGEQRQRREPLEASLRYRGKPMCSLRRQPFVAAANRGDEKGTHPSRSLDPRTCRETVASEAGRMVRDDMPDRDPEGRSLRRFRREPLPVLDHHSLYPFEVSDRAQVLRDQLDRHLGLCRFGGHRYSTTHNPAVRPEFKREECFRSKPTRLRPGMCEGERGDQVAISVNRVARFPASRAPSPPTSATVLRTGSRFAPRRIYRS